MNFGKTEVEISGHGLTMSFRIPRKNLEILPPDMKIIFDQHALVSMYRKYMTLITRKL
jgi:hypothetical protein